MKAKLIALVFGAVFGSSVVNAQSNDCATMAALAYDDAKAKNYDAAYEPLMKVRKECPKYSLATFQYGERALKYKIDNAEGEEKEAFIEELIELWEERLELFPQKTSKGKVYGDIAQLRFDYKIGDKEDQYEAFDKAFTEDPDNFTSPKGIYAYFSLLVDMQDAGERSLEDVFAKYDEVIAKVESEENELAERLAPLLEKQDQAETLTAKEKTLVKNSEINLKAYNQVKNAINGKLGQRADCDNLIPLYTKDFDEKKTDVDWLRNANARLSAKDCTEDPLFMRVSEALHKLDPSAKSAFSLGQLAEAEGNRSKALQYYNEAAELEKDNSAKARIYYRIAGNYKDQGSFSQARTYYRRALRAKPSLGSAYLQIASMYAQSANNCGNTTFEKRAVYWAAADYARRAASVDPSIASNASQAASSYMGRAPQKSDIFQEGRNAGEAIKIGCWIGETVRIPNL
ncbi:MAG: hypothetical protein ACQEWD_08650 [Bacteroidota bacterium]